MWKAMVLVAGLAGLVATSAEAAPKGQLVPGKECVVPKAYKGKLIRKVIRPGCGTPHVNDRKGRIWTGPYFPTITLWSLQTADGTLQLDLDDSKALWKQANDLLEKQVIVTGMPRGGRIFVVGLKADDLVVLTGKLITNVRLIEGNIPFPLPLPRPLGPVETHVDRPTCLPIPFIVEWHVEVRGTRHLLSLSPAMQKKAETLIGKEVIITGKKNGNVLIVSSLEPLVTVGPRL